MAKQINKKCYVGEIVFLAESMQKHDCWISAMPFEQLHVENQLRVEVYCIIQPKLTIDFDGGFVDRDP